MFKLFIKNVHKKEIFWFKISKFVRIMPNIVWGVKTILLHAYRYYANTNLLYTVKSVVNLYIICTRPWIEPLFFKLSCTQRDTQTDAQTHRHADGHEYSIVAVDKPQL